MATDKSRYLEGMIETTLIPGKLEEFITQVTPVKVDEFGSIYGDDKLTGLLKDVVKETDPAAKITKAKILRDAVKVSSVLYSDENGSGENMEGETSESFSAKDKACPVHGSAPKAEGLPNQVNKDDANAVAGNPVKDAALNDLVSSAAKLVSSVSDLAKITGTKAAPTSFADGSANPNQDFAGGPRMEIQNGEAVSSIPASVPADSEHVSVFAEDIKEGDVFNGRRVNAITEEINPINGQTLYSFELDDRSILRACAGTPVTFSYKSDNEESNMDENTQFSESEVLAIEDFQKGIRTYGENFSTIMDYHDTNENFNAEEYTAIFSVLEEEEANDPMNQLQAKVDAIYGALFSEDTEEDAGAEENTNEEVTEAEDASEFSDEEINEYAASQFAEVLAGCENVELDEESGLIFAEYQGTPLVFSDEDNMVYTFDASDNFAEGEEPTITPVISYSDLLFGEDESNEESNEEVGENTEAEDGDFSGGTDIAAVKHAKNGAAHEEALQKGLNHATDQYETLKKKMGNNPEKLKKLNAAFKSRYEKLCGANKNYSEEQK